MIYLQKPIVPYCIKVAISIYSILNYAAQESSRSEFDSLLLTLQEQTGSSSIAEATAAPSEKSLKTAAATS